MKGSLAVFDVDGTLFRRGLLPALTRRLVNEGIFSERVREELSRDYYAWVERRGSYDTYDGLVVDLFLRELEGFLNDAEVGLEIFVGMEDTVSDVGFLDLVCTPIAFNPYRSLF